MTNTRILVIDDNPTALAMVSFLLKQRKEYEVISTHNPKRALEIVNSEDCPDIVISDVEMPELRGPELVNEIRRASPETRCILMSASSHCRVEIPADVPLLLKPIDSKELFGTVKKALSESTVIDLQHALQNTELRNRVEPSENGFNSVRQISERTIEESN